MLSVSVNLGSITLLQPLVTTAKHPPSHLTSAQRGKKMQQSEDGRRQQAKEKSLIHYSLQMRIET